MSTLRPVPGICPDDIRILSNEQLSTICRTRAQHFDNTTSSPLQTKPTNSSPFPSTRYNKFGGFQIPSYTHICVLRIYLRVKINLIYLFITPMHCVFLFLYSEF